MSIPDPDFFDFMMEGGDELLNTQGCSNCGEVIYLDQDIEWLDEAERIAKCPRCGKGIKIT